MESSRARKREIVPSPLNGYRGKAIRAYLEAKLLFTKTIETLQKPYNDTPEITLPFCAAFTDSQSRIDDD